MLKSKKLMMILSLLIAVILWAYVMNDTDPMITKKYKAVPVQILNEEDIRDRGFEIAGSTRNPTADISIRGRRSQLLGYDANRIGASVDLDGLSLGTHLLSVSMDGRDLVRKGLEITNHPTVTIKITKKAASHNNSNNNNESVDEPQASPSQSDEPGAPYFSQDLPPADLTPGDEAGDGDTEN